jgi:hypothetical protein
MINRNDFYHQDFEFRILKYYNIPWGEKLVVFIKFKNEILRPYGLRMTGKG